MKIELGYWWPFARTAWGWVVASCASNNTHNRTDRPRCLVLPTIEALLHLEQSME
jgi:hypothetical protein